jgi:MtrB/PioB family decaheme-associated outer membrane protein
MKRLVTILACLLVVPHAAAGQDASPVRISGSLATGVLQRDNDTNSAKFNEYRDLRDNFYLFDLRVDLLDTRNGRFLELGGTNVTRDDQRIRFDAGHTGLWRVDVHWNGIPHNFSNHAQSPYIRRGSSLFEVPATIPITFKRLATAAADAPGVLASDQLIANYAINHVRPVDLATQRNTGSVSFRYDGFDALALGVHYVNERRDGTRMTYGPIGDRPPRTLNIQFTEPVDQRMQDLTLSAEHTGAAFQVGASYTFSDFANQHDTLVWQNMYVTPEPGATFDVWDRLVSVYGRRPLAPDNRYHNATVTAGGDLPFDSRLTASFSYGRMDQNQALLPYSYHVNALAVQQLPRGTADARMNTTFFTANYAVSPVPRMTLRASFRRFGLDNDTPEDRWQYVTSDTSNLNGTVTYKNKRINLAYAYDRQNAGIETDFRLPFWRSILGVGFERENVDRDYREANTAENALRASFRMRPARGINLQARYRFADRNADGYNGIVTRQSYWYAPGEATDADNPQFTFSNHPDMRRYDVSDRRRNQLDFTAGVTPRGNVTLSASVRYRNDDFDSGVVPAQPLLGTGFPDQAASTPGDQLGLREEERVRYGLDAFYMPSDRLTVNAFLSLDTGRFLQRNLEYNENNKQNPSAVATAELGPWTRATSQWTADNDDRTRSAGAGFTYAFVPERVTLGANYTVSVGRLDIEYGGFGVTNWTGVEFPPSHQFAFRTPPPIRHDWHVLDVTLDFPVAGALMMRLGYLFDRYRLRDWQQEIETFFFEPVGSEYLLRDTSRSHQWGNRLFNMGSYLAPGYNGQVGYLSLRYRF